MTRDTLGLSQERLPAIFSRRAGEVRVIARALNDYLREADVEVSGSVAASDYSQEAAFADKYIADPILHVIWRGQQAMVAAADHLLGLAACIDAEQAGRSGAVRTLEGTEGPQVPGWAPHSRGV